MRDLSPGTRRLALGNLRHVARLGRKPDPADRAAERIRVKVPGTGQPDGQRFTPESPRTQGILRVSDRFFGTFRVIWRDILASNWHFFEGS